MIGEWYYDQIIWRGNAHLDHEDSQTEILSMFEDIHSQLVLVRVWNNVDDSPTQKQFLKEIKKDFKQYNLNFYQHNGSLAQHCRDHSETGAGYDESYGFSTSKKRSVALAFARGAMVVADYGQQDKPENQAKLKSSILGNKKSWELEH